MKRITPLLISLAVGLATSCVTTKKHKELQDQYTMLQSNHAENSNAQRENELLQNDVLRLEGERKNQQVALEEATVLAQSLQANYAELSTRYNSLLERNKMLLESSSSEIRGLSERLAQQEDELFKRQRALDNYQKNLESRETDFDAWKAKVNDLQKALYEKEARVNELQRKINLALSNLSAADLTVTPRDGRLYVALSQNLLFQSGSDYIGAAGQDALKQLASILRTNPEMEITVEGHTDNVGSSDTNWRLSTSRANSVVRILTDNGVTPSRITAAGRAFYVPLAPNDTETNRSKNRRVEIILTPKLDELYNIIR